MNSMEREPTEEEEEDFTWEEEDTLQFHNQGEGRILRSAQPSSGVRNTKSWSRESRHRCNG